MLVFARRSLAPPTLPADRAALLLEGAWPDTTVERSPRYSLDESIVPASFEELDAIAAELVEQIIDAGSRSFSNQNLFDLGALKLRYAAVKWLRPIAYLESLGDEALSSTVDLFLEERRDDEYTKLWRAMADRFRFPLRTRVSPCLPNVPPANGYGRQSLSRRMVGRAAAGCAKMLAASRIRSQRGPHVVLCGNPRILNPVCDALLERGVRVSWLVDRFPIRHGWARRRDPIGWIVCKRTKSKEFRISAELPPLSYNGVELGPVVESWFAGQAESQIADVAQRASTMRESLQRDPPTHVVVDEDATPLKRLVICESRKFGASSQVVQHGVCGVRFGFTPLLADRIFAWDDGSRRQLEYWGVEAERISVVGSIAQDSLTSEVRRVRESRDSRETRRILLMLTTPPRDDRPDAVEFFFNSTSHAAMLRFVVEEVARLKNVELIIKRHPRSLVDVALEAALNAEPSLAATIVSHGSLAHWIGRSDCVLSCGSSAGLEAAAAGAPVVQVLPPGSGNIIPAEWYGMLGTARSGSQLRLLLGAALSRSFASGGFAEPSLSQPSPAHRIAELVLDSPTATTRIAGRESPPRIAGAA